jgi:hypothetical protein
VIVRVILKVKYKHLLSPGWDAANSKDPLRPQHHGNLHVYPEQWARISQISASGLAAWFLQRAYQRASAAEHFIPLIYAILPAHRGHRDRDWRLAPRPRLTTASYIPARRVYIDT